MLCIIGAGRLAASRGLFEPAPVCRTLNRFVVMVCLPALQFWLLAIKTDMRNMEVRLIECAAYQELPLGVKGWGKGARAGRTL